MRIQIESNEETFILHNEKLEEGWEETTKEISISIKVSALKNLVSHGLIEETLAWIEENGELCMAEQRRKYHLIAQSNAEKDIELSRQDLLNRDRRIEPPPQIGSVYLLKADNGLFKIGMSKDIKTRVLSLQVASPVAITTIHHFASKNCNWDEKKLHTKYANKRRRGEWFELSEIEVDDIKKIKDYGL